MTQHTASIPTSWPQRMTRSMASNYLRGLYGIRLAPGTLAKLAVTGGGPLFMRDGRFPIYERDDLDSFAVKRLGPKRSSTSDKNYRT